MLILIAAGFQIHPNGETVKLSNCQIMKQEAKKQLVKFLWKLVTALIAAFGGASAVSASVAAGLL